MADKFNILVVDDQIENISLVVDVLENEDYNLSFAQSGLKALEILNASIKQFDLILLDVMMPELNGFKTCERIKSHASLADIPVIFLTARTEVSAIEKGFEAGGVDYITKPFNPIDLVARVKNHLTLSQAKSLLKQNNVDLERKLKQVSGRLTTELEEMQHELISVLMNVIEENSEETGEHVFRVSDLAVALARHHPKLNEEDEQYLYYAAPLHDIGKICIPDHILHKPGKYTAEEFDVMKEHTVKGYELLNKCSRKLFKSCAKIALQHHECWGGDGYPHGLKGEEIHIYARLVSLADVLDALTHERSYKKAWAFDDAFDYIVGLKGSKFDPDFVDILIENKEEFRQLCSNQPLKSSA